MQKHVAALEKLMPVKIPPDTSNLLLCPMPGLIVSINVTEGQEVKAGETLAIVEAMKMENVLRADRDLTVSAINAKQGDSLAVDAVIMEFIELCDPPEDGPAIRDQDQNVAATRSRSNQH